MPDAGVHSAIPHRVPRFAADGIALSDFQEMTASIGRRDELTDGYGNRTR